MYPAKTIQIVGSIKTKPTLLHSNARRGRLNIFRHTLLYKFVFLSFAVRTFVLISSLFLSLVVVVVVDDAV